MRPSCSVASCCRRMCFMIAHDDKADQHVQRERSRGGTRENSVRRDASSRLASIVPQARDATDANAMRAITQRDTVCPNVTTSLRLRPPPARVSRLACPITLRLAGHTSEWRHDQPFPRAPYRPRHVLPTPRNKPAVSRRQPSRKHLRATQRLARNAAAAHDRR